MGILENLKTFIYEKYDNIQTSIKQQKTEQQEKSNLCEMKRLLHEYFDADEPNLTKDEIRKVNAFIKENIVLSDEDEIANYIYSMVRMTRLPLGRDKLARDKEDVLKKLDEGAIISKTTACVAAKTVIIYRKEIKDPITLKNGNTADRIIAKRHIYGISVNPNKSNSIDFVNYSSDMEHVVDTFSRVKAKAFNVKPVLVKVERY